MKNTPTTVKFCKISYTLYSLWRITMNAASLNNQKNVVEFLRKSGYKVKVTHVRNTFPVFAEGPDLDTEDFHYMSQYEYENLLNENRIYIDVMEDNRPNSFKYKDVIRPHGGFTVVEIKCPDGTELRGKYNFKRTEPYVRKQGVRIAINKAFGKVGK